MEQALLYNNNHNNTTCKYDSLRNTHIYYFMKKGNLVDNQFVKKERKCANCEYCKGVDSPKEAINMCNLPKVGSIKPVKSFSQPVVPFLAQI